ncbi:hypothetical protein [Alcanivorax sp.]|uniref:hypothetical protein n=1 Tax=Alcanivorax sp. TaxID=1872427 RepID=UPI0025B9E6B6|nr:hypothetical protein [Alcanivorax sp.]MEE3387246.1 hypothetical protein [Pseudomonadota bacterium]
MKSSSASIRRLPDTRGLPARVSLLAVFLCYAGLVQSQEPQLADAGEAPQNRVSLNQSLSQSDIARLRAQASGKSNAAYIAYPQLILNGSATPHMLPTQVYGQELAVETRELEKSVFSSRPRPRPNGKPSTNWVSRAVMTITPNRSIWWCRRNGCPSNL